MRVGVLKSVVYKRYIYRNGKKFGPYYYHTYRDKGGKTHTRYVDDPKKTSAVTKTLVGKSVFHQHPTLFILLGIIAIMIVGFFVVSNEIQKTAGISSSDGGFNFGKIASNIKSFVTGFTAETLSDPGTSSESSGSDTSSSPENSDADSDSEAMGGSQTESSSENSGETSTETNVETNSGAETSSDQIPMETPNTPVEATPETQTGTISEETNSDQISSESSNETILETDTQNETISEIVNETDSEGNQTSVENETVPETTSGSVSVEDNESESGGGFVGNLTNESAGRIAVSNETPGNLTLDEFNLTNSTLIEEANVTILNVSTNITLQESTKQFGAVLGKPVRWEKKVKVSVEGANSTNGLTIDLPSAAGNVSVRKIRDNHEEEIVAYVSNEKNVDEAEPVKNASEINSSEEPGNSFLTTAFNFILGFFSRGITGNIVDEGTGNVSVEISEEIQNQDEIVLEYLTDAPYSIEEIVENGKHVTLVGLEDIHYENVLAFTELSEDLKIVDPSKIKIYWEENSTYLPFETVLDLNGNGIYDYIEWIAPHLSNQTFDIIVITMASHLDENRSFISDIYEEVKELDGVWSETIPKGDYVRVTFERNLTSERDITIWPRIVNGTPRIEVYEENGDDLIAEFSSLTEDSYNKVYLTGLTGEQDIFDLRVLDGDVEFDHIIDPTYIRITSGNVSIDIYNTQGTRPISRAFQMRWDISSIPTGGTISNATVCLNETSSSFAIMPDADLNMSRINNQTWSTGHWSEVNSQITNSTTAYNWFNETGGSTLGAGKWWCANVTSQFITDYNLGNTYTSFRFLDVDSQGAWTESTLTDDTTLRFGGTAPAIFASSSHGTASSRPYLDVYYEPGGVPSNEPPQWSLNSTNDTGHGHYIEHEVYWTDDTDLSGYIFSFDNGTGTFVNDSFVGMTGTGNWSNVTKLVNQTLGSMIRWIVYANDSDGEWNYTSTFTYLTSDNGPNVSLYSPENASVKSDIYVNATFIANVTDDVNITNVTFYSDYLYGGWKNISTNTTFGFTNVPYSYSVNLSSWKDAGELLDATTGFDICTNGTNGWAVNDANNITMYSINQSTGLWNITGNFSSPGVSFTRACDALGDKMVVYALIAEDIYYIWNNNGTIISSCDVSGIADGGIAQGIAFINETDLILHEDRGSSGMAHHTNTTCYDFNQNFTTTGSQPVEIDSDGGFLYVLESGLATDEIITVWNYIDFDGTWVTNISAPSILGCTGAGCDMIGLAIPPEQTIAETIYTKLNGPVEITGISRKVTGIVLWNYLAYDNLSQSDWGDTNYTLYLDSPPKVILQSPDNAEIFDTSSIDFTCYVEDYEDLVNVSLWGNWNGGWHLNSTVNFTGAPNITNSATFEISGVSDGDYSWNCQVYDNRSQSTFASSNRTFSNDLCGVTQISSSTTLTQSECEYYNITVDDIVLDCDGYTINGNNTADFWGIEATHRDNVTIRDCVMEEYSKGVLFDGTNNSLIDNATLYNISLVNTTTISVYGVSLTNSDNNTIQDSNLTYFWSNSSSETCVEGTSSDFYGIYVKQADNLSVDNTVLENFNGQWYGDSSEDLGCQGGYIDVGRGIHIESTGGSSDGFTLTDSTLNNFVEDAVVIENATNSFINGSSMSNADKLLVFQYGGPITVYGNTLNYSGSDAIILGDSGFLPSLSDNLMISGNSFNHHSGYGIYLSSVFSQSGTVSIDQNSFYNISNYYVYARSGLDEMNDNYFEALNSFTSTGAYLDTNGVYSIDNNTFFNFNGTGAICINTIDPTTINALNITNCYRGLYVNDNGINLTNSTITSCSNADVYMTTNGDNTRFYNVSFNRSNVDFATNGQGWLENYNNFRMNITNQNLAPVQTANIDIKDAHDWLIVDDDTTDSNGFTPWRWTLEYNQTGDATYNSGCVGSGSYINCSTPHNVTASKTGYLTNSSNFTIDDDATGHLIIATPYITSYVPVTDSFSINEPENKTFSIAYANTTPITIKWFIDGVEDVSYRNLSQFIWVGNYSQAGTYEIKVNISNDIGEDDQIWTMTVIDTPATIDLDLIYPMTNINVSNGTFYNVTLNVTCRNADCYTVNVSLAVNGSLVSASSSGTPFYTNASSNPLTTASLSLNQSELVTFWVNATGIIGNVYAFHAFANQTSTPSVSNSTYIWNVTIVQGFSVAIDLSTKLAQQINWTLLSLPAFNQSADGNNGTGITEYWINVSVEGGTADLFMKADGALTSAGGDLILLANETYSSNVTNDTVPSTDKFSITTDFSDNKIGDALPIGNTLIYLKFFLNAPAAQPAGTYNNTLEFKAVQTGQTP